MKHIIPDSIRPIAGLQYSSEMQQVAAKMAEAARIQHEMFVELLIMAQWTGISKERHAAVWEASDLSWHNYKTAIYFAFHSLEGHELTFSSTQN